MINEALGRKRQAARRATIIPFDGGATTNGVPQSADSFATEEAGPEREAMRHELSTLIERRIDALPEVFRVVFVLRAVEELSVEETADLLDIPEATVRTRFFRARGLLRESLAREVDTALDGAFAFDGVRCDRIVAAVFERLGARLPP